MCKVEIADEHGLEGFKLELKQGFFATFLFVVTSKKGVINNGQRRIS